MNKDLAIDVCRRLVALENELFDDYRVTWEHQSDDLSCAHETTPTLSAIIADAKKVAEEEAEYEAQCAAFAKEVGPLRELEATLKAAIRPEPPPLYDVFAVPRSAPPHRYIGTVTTTAADGQEDIPTPDPATSSKRDSDPRS